MPLLVANVYPKIPADSMPISNLSPAPLNGQLITVNAWVVILQLPMQPVTLDVMSIVKRAVEQEAPTAYLVKMDFIYQGPHA